MRKIGAKSVMSIASDQVASESVMTNIDSRDDFTDMKVIVII